jgi:hypothetical protein
MNLLHNLSFYYKLEFLKKVFKDLEFFSIPIYQGSILYIFDFLTIENLGECKNAVAKHSWWLDIEVLTFYIYMSIVVLTLLKSRFFNVGVLR